MNNRCRACDLHSDQRSWWVPTVKICTDVPRGSKVHCADDIARMILRGRYCADDDGQPLRKLVRSKCSHLTKWFNLTNVYGAPGLVSINFCWEACFGDTCCKHRVLPSQGLQGLRAQGSKTPFRTVTVCITNCYN